MKSHFSNGIVHILSGIAVGVIGSYLIIDWQEEKLVYVLSEPVQLGEVSYQSLTIRNAGWNPATNVIISLDKDYSGKVSAYSNPEFNVKVIEKNSIGGFERIRKDEKATVGFSVNSGRLETAMISIKSDRRVASAESNK